jgi:hypothetical protein
MPKGTALLLGNKGAKGQGSALDPLGPEAPQTPITLR